MTHQKFYSHVQAKLRKLMGANMQYRGAADEDRKIVGLARDISKKLMAMRPQLPESIAFGLAYFMIMDVLLENAHGFSVEYFRLLGNLELEDKCGVCTNRVRQFFGEDGKR